MDFLKPRSLSHRPATAPTETQQPSAFTRVAHEVHAMTDEDRDALQELMQMFDLTEDDMGETYFVPCPVPDYVFKNGDDLASGDPKRTCTDREVTYMFRNFQPEIGAGENWAHSPGIIEIK